MPIHLAEQPGETNSEGAFFFWLAKQRNAADIPYEEQTLVVWLNGKRTL
jgi:carboxypeptidase C (cathepsin A)